MRRWNRRVGWCLAVLAVLLSVLGPLLRHAAATAADESRTDELGLRIAICTATGLRFITLDVTDFDAIDGESAPADDGAGQERRTHDAPPCPVCLSCPTAQVSVGQGPQLGLAWRIAAAVPWTPKAAPILRPTDRAVFRPRDPPVPT